MTWTFSRRMAERTISQSSPLAPVRLTVRMSRSRLTRSLLPLSLPSLCALAEDTAAGQAATGLEVPPTTLNHRLRHHCQSFRLLPKHRSFRLAPDPGARAKPKRRAADTARLLALVPNLEPLGPFI